MKQMPMTSNNPSSAKKNYSATTSTTMMGPAEHGLRCPRCDSADTKFCYYNNYSLSQPRHFCKTCRRYWTKGGALRNVPFGGGCRHRKSNKSKSSSSSSLSPSSLAAFSLSSSSSAALPHMLPYHNYAISDLHWKLQQQRLQALLYGDGGGDQALINKATTSTPRAENQQVGNPYSMERPRAAGSTNNTATPAAAAAAAWFLENPYSMHYNASSTSHHHHHPTAASNSNASDHWSGMQTSWSDMLQFTALP